MMRGGARCCDAAALDLAAEGAGARQRADRAAPDFGAAAVGSGGNAAADGAADAAGTDGGGSGRAGGGWELLGAADGSAGKASVGADADAAARRCSALSRCCCWSCLGCGAATSCHSGSLRTSACNSAPAICQIAPQAALPMLLGWSPLMANWWE